MQSQLKKSYKFAIKTSLYITLFLTLFTSVFLFYLNCLSILTIALFALACYSFSFFVIQYRVERFIYKRIKKIYDDLTLLESTTLRKQPITTDMATLTKQIDQYAKDKN